MLFVVAAKKKNKIRMQDDPVAAIFLNMQTLITL